jgi:hypothetical protein
MGRRSLELVTGALVVLALLVAARDKQIGIDEAIWTYVARVWVEDGVPPYQGPVENKPPGIFYVFALSQALTGPGYMVPRLLAVAAIAGCCLALYGIGRRLGDRLTGSMAALVCGLAMASQAVRGREPAMTESYMVGCTALAILLVVMAAPRAPRARRWPMLAAGLALGGGLAFKQVAGASALAVAALAWMLTPSGDRRVARWGADMMLAVAGALLATAISLAPLLVAGVSLAEYWQGAWLLLFDPGSGLTGLGPRLQRLWGKMAHPLSTLTVLFGAFLLCRRPLVARNVAWGAIAVWSAFEWLGVSASGYFFAHQFRQVVPVLSLAAGVLASLAVSALGRWRLGPTTAPGVMVALVALAMIPQQPVLDVVTGRAPRPAYAPHGEVGAWVRDHTRPGDLVFPVVFGGIVQAVSERRSPSRYFNDHFLKTPAARAEALGDLARRPPRMIVVEGGPPDWLAGVLADYRPVHRQERFTVFERRSPAGSELRGRRREVLVAAAREVGVGVAHELGPRRAQHDLKVCGLQAGVLVAVDDVGRARHTVPRAQHGVHAVAGAVLEEDAHRALQDEEDLLDLVGVGGVALAGRHEHDAQREVLGGDEVAPLVLAGAAGADVAVLGAAVAVDAGVGEGVPVRGAVDEPGHLAGQQGAQRFGHRLSPVGVARTPGSPAARPGRPRDCPRAACARPAGSPRTGPAAAPWPCARRRRGRGSGSPRRAAPAPAPGSGAAAPTSRCRPAPAAP